MKSQFETAAGVLSRPFGAWLVPADYPGRCPGLAYYGPLALGAGYEDLALWACYGDFVLGESSIEKLFIGVFRNLEAAA